MIKILQGDCLQKLGELPDASVHCCVTSPPYWGLRDYGVAGQIGLERTPEEYVAKMVEVFREVKRVLREDGTCWVNLGESFWSNQYSEGREKSLETSTDVDGVYSRRIKRNTGIQHKRESATLKPKDLCGIPWRVAFALQADGWWLRSDIIWHKPNPMPESVTDRPTKSHEYIFLLAKSERYFYDAEAIKEPQSEVSGGFQSRAKHGLNSHGNGEDTSRIGNPVGVYNGTRNKRDVWTVNSQPYPESHFATFPEDLIKPCILAGTSAKGCCPKCGAPWERVTTSQRVNEDGKPVNGRAFKDPGIIAGRTHQLPRGARAEATNTNTIGWQPTCSCGEQSTIPCTILDPFAGSGTTGQVALELGRKAILIELNPKYIELIEKRTNVTPGLQLA